MSIGSPFGPAYDNQKAHLDRYHRALRDIEDLIERQPASMHEALFTIAQIRARIEVALGGPLARDVIS